MKLIEYADRDMMFVDLANRLAEELAAHLYHDDEATLVVPGGTTPGPIFDDLCAVSLDWEKINVMLSDERWVPEDSPRSNTALIKDRLLTDKAAKAKYVPLYLEADSVDAALPALQARLDPVLPISVLLLGMGADMHTASLFPGGDNLDKALAPDAPALIPMMPASIDEQRVTLSARVLKEALNIHIVITGQEKKDALAQAQKLSPSDAPVKSILENATIHWAP